MKVTDAPWLAACLGKVDLIEDWCKAVRAEVENRLASGQEVPGYKLVAGKRGNRAWGDPVAVEDLLKNRFRLKTEEMYDFKLISPTSAEKLAPKLDKKTGTPIAARSVAGIGQNALACGYPRKPRQPTRSGKGREAAEV